MFDMVDLASAPVAHAPALRLRLRPLRLEDERAVHAAQREMAEDSFEFAFDLAEDTDWRNYVAARRWMQCGIDLPPGQVSSTFLVATINDEIVGRTSIRHELNDWLLAFGGHIGYGVLPSFRRRGVATEILRQSLVVARAFGVNRALLTCDDGNVASSTVIERNGGVLDPDWPKTDQGTAKRRYWIA
jgi:predicted acetyltransferase